MTDSDRTWPGPDLDLIGLFSALNDHNVDYVVIGGVAANLHGTSRATRDCDVVIDQDAYNLQRLLAAMKELRARPRSDTASADRARTDEVARQDGPTRHPAELQATFLNLQTDAGPLDVLPHLALGDRHHADYRELQQTARYAEFQGDDRSIVVKIASIEHLIVAKQHIDRPRDRSDVAELRNIQMIEQTKSRRSDKTDTN